VGERGRRGGAWGIEGEIARGTQREGSGEGKEEVSIKIDNTCIKSSEGKDSKQWGLCGGGTTGGCDKKGLIIAKLHTAWKEKDGREKDLWRGVFGLSRDWGQKEKWQTGGVRIRVVEMKQRYPLKD